MRCRSRLRSLVALALTATVAAPSGVCVPGPVVLLAAEPTAVATDDPWPRRYTTPDGGTIVLYQPQVASWDNQKTLVLWAAMVHTPKGSTTPVLGTIQAEADTRVSIGERLVDFSTFRILQSNFPGHSKDEAAAAVAALKSGMPLGERVISLDRVLAYYDTSSIRPNTGTGVKADPPTIFYSSRPAVVVNIDGEPVWSPIAGNDLRFAVNTNWDLFEHGPTRTYYLRDNDTWLKSAAVASGGWTAAGTLPASFSKLPNEDNFKEVRAAVPGRQPAAASLPVVYVSTTPAELILSKGQPQYQPVSGTRLQWVSNTESDVFRVGTSGPVYFLVAGRWFSAPGFMGPWTFATPTLPGDFTRIPLEHPRSRVLASVPGTPQAAEAVLLAQVPQTARVSKTQVTAPDVAYQGEPRFEPIEQTTVARAVNTDKDIIKVGDLYYLLFQGVWFMSRSPGGPWAVTGSVPGEIYQIPVSSPAHSVTYVTVEDDNDEWVVFAAAAAYTGVMVAWGCAVWGSGWYYPPYIGYGGFYPAYFPHYPTYGYGARYNPWTGAYGRGAAWYGPYGGAGVGARYNPRTGTYARGAAAYGPYGARGVAEAYNPRTGTYGQTRQGSGVYGSWGATGVQRGDDWAATARRTNNAGTTTRATRGSEGGAAVSRRGSEGGGFVGTSGSGDVYAGRDGNVYRKQGDSWQQYGGGGSWNTVDRQSGSVGQLDRDAAARTDGSQRAKEAAAARGGSANTGSYRPSGGTRSTGSTAGGSRSRGGGGRRR